MALTETHTSAEVNSFSSFSFNHLSPFAYFSARTKVAGVAIMDPNTIITTTYSGLNDRLLVAEILLPHQRDSIKVTVLYAPDSGKRQVAAVKFFNKCHKHISKDMELIMGDFNWASSPEDSSSGKVKHLVAQALLIRVFNHCYFKGVVSHS